MNAGSTDDSITIEPFGTLPDGRRADLFRLVNGRGMAVSITTYGGAITALSTADRHGRFADVVLGSDRLDTYRAHPYLGTIIGRFANRIGRGTFELDGETYTLACNDGDNHLHGGHRGFDKVLWRPLTSSNRAQLRLGYTSPDGEEGYPGCLNVAVSYTLSNADELRIDYHATTDRPTPINLTSHSFFNLAGEGSGHALDHRLKVNASRFAPVQAGLIPTGEQRQVSGSPFDFREETAVGARIDAADQQLRHGGGYDHSFVLDRDDPGLGPAAELWEPASGRLLSVFTSEPGLHFYSGNFLDGSLVGKTGAAYGCRSGLCLETQHLPDSPNRPEFPSTILRPGQVYRSTTVYRFTTK